MKMIFARIGIRKERQNKNTPCTRIKTKLLTVLTGAVMTFIVCLIAEKMPERTILTSAEMAEEGFSLPVVCYEGTDAALLSADLDHLTKTGAETVTCSEVLSMVRGMKEIPEKPVLLLFTGSGREVFTGYLPVLQEKKAKANAVICGSDADLYSGSIPKTEEAKLSWNEIRELEKSDRIEILSGGYALCHTEKKLSEKAMREDILTMQTRMNEELSHDASVFACPEETDGQLFKELGFLMTLEQGDEVSFIEDEDDLFSVEYIRRGESPTAEFFAFGQ